MVAQCLALSHCKNKAMEGQAWWSTQSEVSLRKARNLCRYSGPEIGKVGSFCRHPQTQYLELDFQPNQSLSQPGREELKGGRGTPSPHLWGKQVSCLGSFPASGTLCWEPSFLPDLASLPRPCHRPLEFSAVPREPQLQGRQAEILLVV